MNCPPLITIIVLAYNLEAYIEQCLSSIINQTFDDFEVIIVNDGSTDSTGKICDTYSKKYNNISVCHQENGGISAARNKGLSVANGDYLWWVDGDDFITKDALTILNTLILKYDKKLDVLGFSFNEIKKDKITSYRKKEILIPVNGETFLKYYDRLAVWSFLYKRSVIQGNSINFYDNITLFEDNFFNIEVFNQSNGPNKSSFVQL